MISHVFSFSGKYFELRKTQIDIHSEDGKFGFRMKGGLGTPLDEAIYIRSVLEESPAAIAGVLKNDKVHYLQF